MTQSPRAAASAPIPSSLPTCANNDLTQRAAGAGVCQMCFWWGSSFLFPPSIVLGLWRELWRIKIKMNYLKIGILSVFPYSIPELPKEEKHFLLVEGVPAQGRVWKGMSFKL